VKIKFLFFIFITISISCSLFEEEKEQQKTEIMASVDSISIQSISDTNIEFTVFCTTPTPCWGFSRFEENRDTSDISIKVFIFSTTDDPCITVLGNIQIPLSMQVPYSGTYNFHFFQNDTTTFDTIISIP